MRTAIMQNFSIISTIGADELLNDFHFQLLRWEHMSESSSGYDEGSKLIFHRGGALAFAPWTQQRVWCLMIQNRALGDIELKLGHPEVL